MEYPRIEEKNDQSLWNFFFSALFALLLALSILYFYQAYGRVPWGRVSPFDMFLMSLAVFRITRLLVYDKITQFLRDMFLSTRLIKDEHGNTFVERSLYKTGPLRTIHDLLGCPWCVGVWASLIVVFSYFTFSFAWYVIFLLAVAALGSFFQVLSNMVGWRAETLKLKAQEYIKDR